MVKLRKIVPRYKYGGTQMRLCVQRMSLKLNAPAVTIHETLNSNLVAVTPNAQSHMVYAEAE